MKNRIERLPHQCGKRVGVPHLFCNRIRNKRAVFVGSNAVIGNLNFVCADTDHFKRNTRDSNRLPNCRTIPKQAICRFEAQENDAPPLFDVFRIQKAPFERNLRPHGAVIGSDAANAKARLPQIGTQRKHIHVFGTGIFDQRGLKDRLDILLLKKNPFAGPLSAGLNAGLTAVADNNAIGECTSKSDDDRAIESIAIGHQQHDRHDSPRNAKHRHRSAESMIDQRGHGFEENLFEDHRYISNLKASTGSSSAARRAG